MIVAFFKFRNYFKFNDESFTPLLLIGLHCPLLEYEDARRSSRTQPSKQFSTDIINHILRSSSGA